MACAPLFMAARVASLAVLFGSFERSTSESPFARRPFDVSPFMLQTPLLEYAQMRIVPGWLSDFPFGEANIQGGEMTA